MKLQKCPTNLQRIKGKFPRSQPGKGLLEDVLIHYTSGKLTAGTKNAMEVDGSDDFPDFNWVIFP